MQFHGRTALVTGGSSRIGQATCRMLAEEGSAVAIHYHRNAEATTLLADDLRSRGARVMIVQADVVDRAEVNRMIAEVSASLGKIDLLATSAGESVARMPLAEEPPDLWQRTLDLNLNSVLCVSQAVLPDMIRQKWGRIVNVASRAGREAGQQRRRGVCRVQGRRHGTDQGARERERGAQCASQLRGAPVDRQRPL